MNYGAGRRMEPRLAVRPMGEIRVRDEVTIPLARPLLRPAPRSAMFFPLVVLVAVLPGLYALNNWDLNPPGPWWGLRGLAVLDGQVVDQVPAVAAIKPALEARAFRAVAFQPPLYAWLEAIGLGLSADRDPRTTVLPSYVAGVLVVVLVYFHGRLWQGPGLGLIAAILVGFNRSLLFQMQQAAPTTLALAGTLTVLLCYGRHLQIESDSTRVWAWGGSAFWTIGGGLALGLALMSVGGFGLIAVPVILLHQAYLRAGSPPGERHRAARRWLAWRTSPSLAAGAIALAIALTLAVPWHAWMLAVHGGASLATLLVPNTLSRSGLLARLIFLSPAIVPLGLFAAVRMIRQALTDETDDRAIVGGAFWVLWLAVAAVAPACWPHGPRAALNLFLLVPLSLLAARAICDLASRTVAIRTLTWLAPATAVCVAWRTSTNLQGAFDSLVHARADTATALGLHLALDLIFGAIVITRALDRWARRRDDRQRGVLGGVLGAVLLLTGAGGISEVRFRHVETGDLLTLRAMILRRDREQPFNLLAVVSPVASAGTTTERVAPGGRLRFILRSALPHLPQLDLSDTNALLALPEGQRLVILAGTGERLSYDVQSRLGLEAIHPGRSGILDAFATANLVSQKRTERRFLK